MAQMALLCLHISLAVTYAGVYLAALAWRLCAAAWRGWRAGWRQGWTQDRQR